MGDLCKMISALDKIVKRLFYVSCILIFLIEFVFSRCTELFNGGAKIGTIISGLSLSVIASTIFYFFLVHIKDYRDKAAMNKFITASAIGLVGLGYTLFDGLAKGSKVVFAGLFPSKNEIEEICKNISLNGLSELHNGPPYKPVSWILFMNEYSLLTRKLSERIFLLMPYTPTSLLKITFEINDCFFLGQVNRIAMNPNLISKQDISFMSPQMLDYSILIKELVDVMKEHYPETKTSFRSYFQNGRDQLEKEKENQNSKFC